MMPAPVRVVKETAVRCPMESATSSDLALDYCAHRLNPEKTKWFERHLEDCASCRKLVDAQRQVWEALDDWDPAEVSTSFDRCIKAKIEAARGKRWLRIAFGTGWLGRAIPVASAATVALTIFLARTPNVPSTNVQRFAEPVEVEQAERALEDLDMIQQIVFPPREACGGGTT